MAIDSDNALWYIEAASPTFASNSPQGYCEKCKAIGSVNIIDYEKVMPDKTLSIYEGGILPLGKDKNSLIFWQIEAICKQYDFSLKTP